MHQFVAHRVAHAIVARGIDDFPVAGFERVNQPLGVLLGAEQGRFGVERIAVGVVFTQGDSFGIDLIHGVVVAIDRHIHPHTKDMLMVGGIELWG